MAQGILGIVAPVWKGDYDNDTTYQKLNMVRYNSEIWIYINETESIGNPPIEGGGYWSKMIDKVTPTSFTTEEWAEVWKS